MANATKAQLEAIDKPAENDNDWTPGQTKKGTSLERVIVYAQDARCKLTVKKRGEDSGTYTYQMASQVPSYTAAHFGMDALDKSDLPEGVSAFVKGSKNGVSIKVPWMEGGKPKISPKGNHYLVAMPMPGGATIPKIMAFLLTECKSNKPSYFISPRGAKHYLPRR